MNKGSKVKAEMSPPGEVERGKVMPPHFWVTAAYIL